MAMPEKHPLRGVELIPAFFWTCEACDQENFARAIVAEFSEEEMQELRSEHGVQPWETGDFMTQPDIVQCSGCERKFTTTEYGTE